MPPSVPVLQLTVGQFLAFRSRAPLGVIGPHQSSKTPWKSQPLPVFLQAYDVSEGRCDLWQVAKSAWFHIQQGAGEIYGQGQEEGPFVEGITALADPGPIYCANCGYKHHEHRHNRNGTPYYYYEDSGFNLHGRSACSQSMIPKEGLEQFVIDEISSRVLQR